MLFRTMQPFEALATKLQVDVINSSLVYHKIHGVELYGSVIKAANSIENLDPCR